MQEFLKNNSAMQTAKLSTVIWQAFRQL